MYNSDYEVRLATYLAMGGDGTRTFNSVYEIDLEILRLTEEGGGGGGGVTEDEVQDMIDAGLDPILIKEGETYTQDLADALAELGTDRAKWCERVYFCLSNSTGYYRCALFTSAGIIGGAFCFQGNAFMISFHKNSQHVGNAITFMKAELANKSDLPASTDPIKFYIGQTLTQDMYDKIWAITDSTEFARRMVLRENPAMINIFNWIPVCGLVNQNERYVQYYRFEDGYVRFIEINFKNFQVGSTITAETSQPLAWLNNIPTGYVTKQSLTQSEYDAMSEAGTLDENTLYIITDAE